MSISIDQFDNYDDGLDAILGKPELAPALSFFHSFLGAQGYLWALQLILDGKGLGFEIVHCRFYSSTIDKKPFDGLLFYLEFDSRRMGEVIVSPEQFMSICRQINALRLKLDPEWRSIAQGLFTSEDLAFTEAEARPDEDQYARRWRERLKRREEFLKDYVYGRYPNAVHRFFMHKRDGEFAEIVEKLLMRQPCSHYQDSWDFLDDDQNEPGIWVIMREAYCSRPPSRHHKFSRSRFHELLRLVTYGYLQRWSQKRGQMQAIFERHGLHMEPAPESLRRLDGTDFFQPL